MPPSAFGLEVHRRIVARADPAVKAGAERYFKGEVRFLGLNMPGTRLVAREVEPLLGRRPGAEVMAECFRLMHSPWAEERHVGITLLGRNLHRLPKDFLGRLEPVFDRTVHDWAACDHLAGGVLRPLVATNAAARRRIVSWRKARSPWRQRASAVAFLAEAHYGRQTSAILTICRSLARNPDRFAQLGMGWLLRELSVADRPSALTFLSKNYRRINREALRYAIEKMPRSLQRTVLAEHATARSGFPPRGGRRAT